MHVPVLLQEAVEGLKIARGATIVDATAGFGGHSKAIAEAVGEKGKVIALDADPFAAAQAQKNLATMPWAEVVHASYHDLQTVLHERSIDNIDGILFDLGLSSYQIDASGRGFSFLKPDEPLDMRFDTTKGHTAAELLNSAPVDRLVEWFRAYGDEPRARQLALAIADQRAVKHIVTVADLLEVVARVKGSRRIRGLHPATMIFQALRIATNHELEWLADSLLRAIDALRPGGRICVIAFHSGEDRIVKNVLRDEAKGCICPPNFPECRCGKTPRVRVLTKKPIRPQAEEVAKNSRARSAVLRIAEKI